MSKVSSEFTISRLLDAPRETVWKAWTTEDQLKAWFGPKECPISQCTLDFHPSGTFLYAMQTPGGEMWGKWMFREIHEPDKLICICSFSNEQGDTTRAPFNDKWPLETLSMTTFADEGDKTLLMLRWSALNATEEEEMIFHDNFESMTQGWSGTFDQLDAFLAKHK